MAPIFQIGDRVTAIGELYSGYDPQGYNHDIKKGETGTVDGVDPGKSFGKGLFTVEWDKLKKPGRYWYAADKLQIKGVTGPIQIHDIIKSWIEEARAVVESVKDKHQEESLTIEHDNRSYTKVIARGFDPGPALVENMEVGDDGTVNFVLCPRSMYSMEPVDAFIQSLSMDDCEQLLCHLTVIVTPKTYQLIKALYYGKQVTGKLFVPEYNCRVEAKFIWMSIPDPSLYPELKPKKSTGLSLKPKEEIAAEITKTKGIEMDHHTVRDAIQQRTHIALKPTEIWKNWENKQVSEKKRKQARKELVGDAKVAAAIQLDRGKTDTRVAKNGSFFPRSIYMPHRIGRLTRKIRSDDWEW
jgi:hypothetical protein